VRLSRNKKELPGSFVNPLSSRITVLVVASFVSSVAVAQAPPALPLPAVSPPAAISPLTAPPSAPPVPGKIHIAEGTEVPLLFVDPVSSATNAEGDRFTLRVDGDVKVGGQVAIKSGAVAVGIVTSAHKRGFMGKAGELNVMLDHVSVGDDRIRLRASKGKTGDAKVGATVALTILFGPIGLLKRGHDIDIKPGTPITAFVDQAQDIAAPQ